MRSLGIILLAAACAGCQPSSPQTPSLVGSDMFDIIPPIADADPSIRQPVAVRLPIGMHAVRQGNSLLVTFPTIETNLMVGHKMVTGIQREEFITIAGAAKPHGMSLQGGLEFQSNTNVLALGRQGFPPAGQEFMLEHRVTMFETDLPAQHLWSPRGGKHYKVLWTQTFKETIK